MEKRVIKTDCILCVWGCGINAYVEDGRLVRVEGMTEHPLNQGILCPRGEHLVDYVYSPDRLKYPMKKVNGDWESPENIFLKCAPFLTRLDPVRRLKNRMWWLKSKKHYTKLCTEYIMCLSHNI